MKSLLCYQNFSETDIIKMFGWAWFSPDSRHANGYQLYSSSHCLVPWFYRAILHTGASEENQKEASTTH